MTRVNALALRAQGSFGEDSFDGLERVGMLACAESTVD
jgi:hypothetical protein